MKALLTTIPFLLATLTHAVDYSQKGSNWPDDKCQNGQKQSPVNIDTNNLQANQKVKFVLDFMSFENVTMNLSSTLDKLYVNVSQYSHVNMLDYWN